MFATRLPALLVLAAAGLACTNSASAQEASISAWTYHIDVEITHFNGSTYWSNGYETDDAQEAAFVWMLFESAFENGDLQDYFGSSTAYVSDIRFRRVSNIQQVEPNFAVPRYSRY
jgi:hypothetical protein